MKLTPDNFKIGKIYELIWNSSSENLIIIRDVIKIKSITITGKCILTTLITNAEEDLGSIMYDYEYLNLILNEL